MCVPGQSVAKALQPRGGRRAKEEQTDKQQVDKDELLEIHLLAHSISPLKPTCVLRQLLELAEQVKSRPEARSPVSEPRDY